MKRAPGRPFTKNDPRHRPGPGRLPEEFKRWLRGMFDDPKERTRLWARARKSDYLMGKLLAYAFGQPPQHIETLGEIRPQGAVLVVGDDTKSYIEGLRIARGEAAPAE